MTDYKKAIHVLSKICGISDITTNKRDKLIDIKLNTEDLILIGKIDNLLTHFTEVRRLKNIKMYMKCSNEFKLLMSLRDDLILYCESMMASNKPEWMILAERQGWRPPC